MFGQADHKKAVEDLNLGRWFVGKHAQFGSELLDFRENVSLHSGSIIGSLLMMRSTYEDVGIVNPRFLDFAMSEQREQIARSYGAAEPGVKKNITGYLRMRYLHKVIKLQSHFPVEDEPEEEK
ncbi:hypothetical protein PInf_000656 [Phytophthora infestans]|nr:hypothetical protein PInf_000656 [Phytophthora infestans]